RAVGQYPQAPRRRHRGRGRDQGGARRPFVPFAARSRHRHRAHAGTVRRRDRARPRPRPLARHAGAGARAARARGAAPLQRAPGRYLRSCAAEGFLRRRHHPSGATLPRRQRARDHGGRPRAAARRPPVGGRFRPARSRIPARRARAPAAGLRGRDGDPVDERGRPAIRAAEDPAARTGLAGQDRRLALARARCAGSDGRAGGCLMDAETRASRFVNSGGERRIHVSFEFFPPKSEEMEKTLWDSITRLAPLKPNFVSVTYGAGGSTRERTHATVKRILNETALIPAAHLTCVAATSSENDGVIRNYCAAGVRHIVALRGDPIGGIGEKYAPHPGGYKNGADLVAGIKRIADVEASVSAYPEKHPDSPTVEADIDMLAAKVD